MAKGVIITPGFDPQAPEDENEFLTFRALVQIDKYSAYGNPIIERMWNCRPGNSKRYLAARDRRDEFAAKIESDSRNLLYGE